MPDAQLLTKQVIARGLNATGQTTNVRFNLQRGKIARIWGFTWGVFTPSNAAVQYTCFVRKTAGVERETTPQDNLWFVVEASNSQGNVFVIRYTSQSVMFPKPHRTSGITVQMHCTASTSSEGLLVIYYDIDDVARGEMIQRWEKSRSKKYDRRMLAP